MVQRRRRRGHPRETLPGSLRNVLDYLNESPGVLLAAEWYMRAFLTQDIDYRMLATAISSRPEQLEAIFLTAILIPRSGSPGTLYSRQRICQALPAKAGTWERGCYGGVLAQDPVGGVNVTKPNHLAVGRRE